MPQTPKHIRGGLVQLGRPERRGPRQVDLSVEMGSTVVFDTLAAFERARGDRCDSGTSYYGRYGNTRGFYDGVPIRMGVEVEYFNPMIGALIADKSAPRPVP